MNLDAEPTDPEVLTLPVSSAAFKAEAGTWRPQTPLVPLLPRLLNEGPRFSFVQAMRLLRLVGGANGAWLKEHVRVRPHLSLAFSETDLVSVEALEESSLFRLTVTFLGLYGSSSPLPTFYTEDLLDEQGDGKSASRDFLDLVNSPVYRLFFQSWGKHRIFYGLLESPQEEYLQRLYCLLGLGSPALLNRVQQPFEMLRYMGLMTQMPRSGEGLRTLLSDRLAEASLVLEPCVKRWAAIPEEQRLALGQKNTRLGEDTHLGSRIEDCMGSFRIEVGPLSGERFQVLRPFGAHFQEMIRLVDFYLDQPLTWHYRLRLQPGEVRPLRLGDPDWACLGVSTWLHTRPWEAPERVAEFPEPHRTFSMITRL